MASGILSKPEGCRTQWDIKMLAKCTNHVKFFEKIGDDTHEQCCKYMTYEKLGPAETLFEIGNFSLFY